MTYYPQYKCWEIMNCGNLNCPARHEPTTPCWEIAKRVDAYHNISNTCKDCAVFILKEESPFLSTKKLQNIITKRMLSQNTRKNHQVCIKEPILTVKNRHKKNYFHFLLHDFFERKVFLENTWCELCDEANLAIFNENEFEIYGSKFISGHCRRCGTKILSGVIEKNIER